MIMEEKIAKIPVRVPFDFCGECPNIEIEKTTYIAGKDPYGTIFECANRKICERAVDRYRGAMKERRKRPCDAMGDDQGWG